MPSDSFWLEGQGETTRLSNWFTLIRSYARIGGMSSSEDKVGAKIFVLLEAVENTQIWETAPTSTNTDVHPWLEEHALPGRIEADKQKILRAARALGEVRYET